MAFRSAAVVSLFLAGICIVPQLAAAESAGPQTAAEARPLLAELAKPQYARSRCMITPVLADNGRAVVKSADRTFLPGDVITAVDNDVLDVTKKTALIEVLEQRPSDAVLMVHLNRAGADRINSAACSDSVPFYDYLRSAAQAALRQDAIACYDYLDKAAERHGLSSIWMRLSMSCRIQAGRLAGNSLWRAEYELFRQRIEEAAYTPGALDGIRHGVRSAVRDLQHNGNATLAVDLQRQLDDAMLHEPRVAHAVEENKPDGR